jgi:glycosyltransferase involved in cell wall biosynthesis
MKKNIIFVGWVNQGRAPVDGETTKNQYIIAELKKYCEVTVLDFYKKNKHPWIYLQALWALISKPKATIILSTSAKNVYGMLIVFKKLRIKRDIIHWVIGGAFGTHVQEGKFRADVFKYVKYNLVQCHGMIDELNNAGITNVRFVLNFKPIPYYPDLDKALAFRKSSKFLRFVFLSRIMPDKGCDYLLDAVRSLNEKGLQEKFAVDFYGKIDNSYKKEFLQKVNSLENVTYRDLLDFRSGKGYDILATYHAMIFPTYWNGEGFAGIFIDAFIAGLPVLASDWMHNSETIKNNKLGIIFPVHQVDVITNVMQDCINGNIDLYTMARNARQEMYKYKAENALPESYLKSIGLIEE